MAAQVEREDRGEDGEKETMEDIPTTLTGTFIVDKKAHEVVLESKTMKWRRADKPHVEYQSVCFEAVFAVISGGTEADTGKGADTSCSKSAEPNTKGKTIVPHFTIHYVNKTPTYLWIAQTVTFNVPENQPALDLTLWVGRIQGYIANPELGRPKRLLVFINPNSGWGQGEQIYNKKTAPLFKLAGVETNVIVTENGDHAEQVFSEYDLDHIDGVVSVGGDGSFLNCFEGLLRRLSKDAGIDLNDATATVRPSIPFGIIPAGTGQSVIKEMTNTKDPVTATLHIIMGERHVLHAHSVYNGGKLISYGVILAGYGIYGDFIRISESVNLGRAKYVYSFGKALASKRIFNAEIHYRPVPEETTVGVSEPGWEVVTGSFCSVHLFNMELTQGRLAKKIKEAGFVPKDPRILTMNLYWATQECPRFRFLKSFIGTITGDDSALDNHYINIRPIKECKIVIDIPELNEETSSFTIDGEPNTLVDKTVHIKGHENLLPVFGSGIYAILGLDKRLEAATEQGRVPRSSNN